RLQLRERFREDLPVLRLHSDRGGEFSSDLLYLCRWEGILQLFTLPASLQRNGFAERRIGLVMEVARTSMIHAAAPHFLWPFATSPTLRWMGKVGDASVFRVWGSRAFVRDTSSDKLSFGAIPCIFLRFPPDAPGWQFYHPTLRRVLPTQDVTFDELVPFCRLFPYHTAPLPLPPLFLALGPPPVDPLPPQCPASSGVSQVDPLPLAELVEVTVDSGAARGGAARGDASGGAEPAGAELGGAKPASAEPGDAEPEGAEPGGAETEGAEPGGAESEGAESEGAEPRGTASAGGPAGALPRYSRRQEPFSPWQLREWFARCTRLRSGAAGAGGPDAGGTGAEGAGATSPGGTGVTAGAGGTGGVGGAVPGGSRTRGIGAAEAGGVGGAGGRDPGAGGAGAGDPRAGGAGVGGAGARGAGARGAGARGTRAGGARAGGAGVGFAGAGGAGAGGKRAGGDGARDPGARGACVGGAGAGGTGAGGTVQRRPFLVLPPPSSPPPPSLVLRQPDSPLPAPSPYAKHADSLTERREPASRFALPVCAVRTGRRVPRPRPPLVPITHIMALRPFFVPLQIPLRSPPASSLADGPDPEYDLVRAASPTITRLLATVVTYPSFVSVVASALVAELVDFAATCRLDCAASLVPESESNCPPSVGGECALGTDVLEDKQEDFECLAAAVPHLVAMLLAPKVDQDAPDIPTPRSYAEAIEGHYSSQWQTAMDAEMASWKSTGTYVDAVPPPGANIRHGLDFFLTFSPTPKMTTLRVLLHVAAQRDYKLHSLEFSTAFLRGNLHEEIWLRRPPGFTGSFLAGTQWSLWRPVYGLCQAPREWHDILRTTLAALGFAPSTADHSLFLRTDISLPPFYILMYFDDLVFATADTEALALVKSELQKRHIFTDLCELRSYLGLQITLTEHGASSP
ncbi:unnamed protein product, partial [Closterium sp. NIES-54]